MCRMISCLVGRNGGVYAIDGEHSHSAIAERLHLDEDKYLKYEFHFKTWTLFQDFNTYNPFPFKQSHDKAALDFFRECCGTVKKLISYVKRGNFSVELFSLLTYEGKDEYYRLHNIYYTKLGNLKYIERFKESQTKAWCKVYSQMKYRVHKKHPKMEL